MGITAWDLAAILDKSLLYGSTLTAAGAVMFLLYAGSITATSIERGIRLRVALLLGVAILVALTRLPLTVGAMTGEFSSLFDPTLTGMVWRAGEGRALELRLAGITLMAIGLQVRRCLLLLGLPGALLAAVSFAALGHTHATGAGPAPIFLIAGHLACVAFWLGGLMCLWVIAAGATALELGRAAQRFGAVAVFMVALLVVTGLPVLWLLVRPLSEFWTSPYGRGLGIKMGLFLGLVGCAALNRLMLTPRLCANDRAAVRFLRRSLGVEIAFVVAILLVTATVTSLFGPEHPSRMQVGVRMPDSVAMFVGVRMRHELDVTAFDATPFPDRHGQSPGQ
jgi:putative copper resistance protein D